MSIHKRTVETASFRLPIEWRKLLVRLSQRTSVDARPKKPTDILCELIQSAGLQTFGVDYMMRYTSLFLSSGFCKQDVGDRCLKKGTILDAHRRICIEKCDYP